MKSKKYFLITILVIIFGMGSVAAEPIMITISSDMDKIIFDGKWTFGTEWKRSSFNTLSYDDGTIIQLRTAHQDNFIYVFIDAISMTQFSKHSDMATICFDSHNNKTIIANENDYCFVSTLDGNAPIVMQGGSSLSLTNNFKKIPNPDGFIGVGGVSDENDRYSPGPHAGYEFRIPTDVVGRSDIYGFYLGVYDAHSNKIYSWPQNVTSDLPLKIPNPTKWGEIVSPDKSLPEFLWPFLSLLAAMIFIVYLTRKQISFN